ncbi:MAG: ImmA/IrrE family metallo-endopeptidase [Candidatus Thiodiazotropha sp. (ex Epidulcina cf. delphinae)]|nr:ImmA/IrrE family metallo-endopeptidase [Candidatus Thiodiazotropha sp. (ex Epidulcina cf. delphinae)]
MNEDIIQLAENLAEDHKYAGGGGDPHIGFGDYEVDLVEDDFYNAFEGLLRYKDGEFQVFINTGHNHSRTKGRCRFTAAHEFGHYCIKSHRDSIRSGKGTHFSKSGFQSKEPMEREADIFAAHFLVPTKALQKRHKSPNWGAMEILDVHAHFETSVTCAALRCQASLPGNSTLILWGKTEVRWQRMDRDWWFDLPARSIRNSSLLANGSATEKVLNGYPIPDEGYVRTGTTRSHWFPRIAPWSTKNDILIEEAIPLGDYGVLTILRPDCR